MPKDDRSFDSADHFARCAILTGARFAIPIASNHCFLHPETRHFNATATTPDLAERRYAAVAAAAGVKTECVVMPPGSLWSDDTGFGIAPFDFSRRDHYVGLMLQRYAAQLASQAELEGSVSADLPAFESYFAEFLPSIPWFIRHRKLANVVFRVLERTGAHHWRVDPRMGVVSAVDAAGPDEVVLEVQALVLNDCARLRMFSVWTASKRLKIHLPSAAALAQANLWFTLLDLYETDSLPISANLSPRSLAVRARRWREPVEVATILFRRILLRQRFSVSRVYPVRSAT